MISFTGLKLEQTHKVRSVLVVLPGAGGHCQLTDHLKKTNYIFHTLGENPFAMSFISDQFLYVWYFYF